MTRKNKILRQMRDRLVDDVKRLNKLCRKSKGNSLDYYKMFDVVDDTQSIIDPDIEDRPPVSTPLAEEPLRYFCFALQRLRAKEVMAIVETLDYYAMYKYEQMYAEYLKECKHERELAIAKHLKARETINIDRGFLLVCPLLSPIARLTIAAIPATL